jgi:hypothetical protein
MGACHDSLGLFQETEAVSTQNQRPLFYEEGRKGKKQHTEGQVIYAKTGRSTSRWTQRRGSGKALQA